MNRIHNQWTMFGLLFPLTALVHPAHAQHLGDVQVRLEGAQLVTENSGGQSRVYVNEFDNFGGSLFTDDPGFESQTGALPGGTPIGFRVLQSLWYWDGEQLASPAANAAVRISLGPVAPVFVTGDSGVQGGFTISTASSAGTIHAHPSYTLSPVDAPFGLYGIILELTSPGYEPSESFLIALNYGLVDLEMFDYGVEAIALASGVVELPAVPGDTDDDGDVDLEDLNNVRNHFGESGSPAPGDTYPFDGAVNLSDLNNVRNNFGATSTARAVAEPSSTLICAAALLAFAVTPRINGNPRSNSLPRPTPSNRKGLNMKSCLRAFVATLVWCFGALAYAQHSDIEVTVADGKLVVSPGVEGYVFEGTLGETIPNFGAEPGFEADDGELQAGDELGFNLLSSLLYWDGAQFAIPANNEQLTISKATFSTVVTPMSGPQVGYIFGEADDEGGLHEDLEFLLARLDAVPDTAVGAYGLWMELTSPRYESSNGFIILLNHELDDEQFEAGVAASARLVPEPSTIGLTGLAAACVLAFSRQSGRYAARFSGRR